MRAPSPSSTIVASAASPRDVVINLRKPSSLKGPHSSPSSNNESSTTECLLKWINNVAIKKRKFRRVSRCSNLLAEAVLNNSLKKAQSELGRKQEEKRQNLARFNQLLAQQQFSKKSYYNRYSLPELLDQQSHDGDKSQNANNNNSQNQNDDSITFYASGSDDNNNNNYYYQAQKKTKLAAAADNYSNFENDEEIRISLSGLDSFFNKLKGI